MKKVLVFLCFILCFSHLSAALQWSNKSQSEMSWFDAVRYCKNLNEGGYKDWRLPSTAQFRELVKNCPGFELGSACNFTDDCIYLNDLDTCLKGCDCPSNENIKSVSYYSKLGDIDELWSSSVFDANDKGIEALTWWHSTRRFMEDDHLNEDLHYVRCVRFQNSDRNRYVKMSENEAERLYIEAKKLVSIFSSSEQCERAITLLLKIMNSADINGEQYEKAKELMLYAWAQLVIQKEEKCEKMAEEAKKQAKAEKPRLLQSLKWSSRSSNTMNWNSAKQYCEELTEGGYTDWRLPNIDELRTLIQNHSGTQSSASCPISEKAGKLSLKDWTKDCGSGDGSNFSKLGGTDYFWSSSTLSDYTDSAWIVDFSDGHAGNNLKSLNDYVRCVR